MSVPNWIQDAIFYQIFPDRFYNGNLHNDPENVQRWGIKPTIWGFQGGDLDGVIQKIDYLVDLGINAIYLNPIFYASSTHRYDTIDYFQIDPKLGDLTTFKRLIEIAHRNELKIILDGVFNHTGRGFFAFNDLLENNENSPYRFWYHVYHFPIDAYGPEKAKDYAAWWGYKSLPKLNTEHSPVRKYLFSVAKYWLEQGADGWRLDVPNEIDDDGFWYEFRKQVHAINPEAYIVGEIWDGNPRWVGERHFDALMNYPLRESLFEFLHKEKTSVQFGQKIDQLLSSYPSEHIFAMFNILGSHDTVRIMNILNQKIALVKLAYLFVFTFPGAPVIYYGDEIGTTGEKDPDCRKAFDWDQDHWNMDIRNFLKKLIQLRRVFPILRRGEYIPLPSEENDLIFCFARRDSRKSFIQVLNVSSEYQFVSIQIDNLGLKAGTRLNNLLGEEQVETDGKTLIFSIPAQTGYLLH
jgi:glycosidase